MGENCESLMGKVGGWGRYQKIIVPLICLFFMPIGFFMFAPVITYLTPPHRCFIPGLDKMNDNASAPNFTTMSAFIPTVQSEDGSMEFSKCVRYVISQNTSFYLLNASFDNTYTTPMQDISTESCRDGWVYMDPEGKITATTEFNLVCSNSWKKPLLTSGLLIGVFIGSAISGPLADKFGRKLSSLANLIVGSLLAVVISVTPSYEVHLSLTVIVGVCMAIWYNSGYVLVQELVDKNHRALVACMANLSFAIGYMILPGVGYLLTDWRWIYRSFGLTNLMFTSYIFFIPESPRWLLSKGRNPEAYAVMSRIARVNGKRESVLDDLKMNNVDLAENFASQKGRARRRSSSEILFTNTVMRNRTFLLCWVWNVSFLCYYAFGYNTSNLGGNSYLNCFVSAALEIPCFFFATFTIQRFGRRNSVSAFIGLTGFFLALSPALSAYNTAAITMAMFGKFFAASSMGILFLYTSELFPTLLRNTGIGIGSMSARIGCASAPFLIYAGENANRYIPFYVMASLGLITSALCLFLPETKQSALPDTLTDAIDLENYRKFRFSCKKRGTRSAALDTRQDSIDDDFEHVVACPESSEP